MESKKFYFLYFITLSLTLNFYYLSLFPNPAQNDVTAQLRSKVLEPKNPDIYY